jgi:hypothetical protein
MNTRLRGYSASIGEADFHPWNLGIDFRELVIRQEAHPEPAVLSCPELAASVQWRALFALRLVADFVLESPAIHANLVQLREENEDAVPIKERGWQDAVQALYPLKINELVIHGGSLTYQDDSGYAPLQVSQVEALVLNIRNVHSDERRYPSSFHVEGRLFESAIAVLDGNADFLAKPRPGVKSAIHLEGLELAYFEPLTKRLGLSVRGGRMRADGWIENSPQVNEVDLESIVISDAYVDYLVGAPKDAQTVEIAKKVGSAAVDLVKRPEAKFRVRRLVLENGSVGVVSTATTPQYRLYVDEANFEVVNLSNVPEDGPAAASLRGKFLGSGDTAGTATLDLTGAKQPVIDVRLEIIEAELKRMNNALRAHANLDVAAGKFSFYTELHVANGTIDGYVKPLFRDIDVYDPDQDKKKNVFRQMYEGMAGGIAKLLENRKRDEVATQTRIYGSVSDPRSSPWQIVSNLVRNAFTEAILPGFEREASRADPALYRRRVREGRERRERENEAKS